jgi:hypothetical protein
MTCDIYRNGTIGGAPAVTGVNCFLQADYEGHTEHGEKDAMDTRYTHTMLMPFGTDCRDGYSYGTYGNAPDVVAIPSGAGTAATYFNVTFVENKANASAAAHLKVYLDRLTPSWPTKYT